MQYEIRVVFILVARKDNTSIYCVVFVGRGDVFMKLILPNIMNSGILTKT